MHLQDGYKTISLIELSNILGSLEKGTISTETSRVYFGCLSIMAIRDAAERCGTKKKGRVETRTRYNVSELEELLDTSKEVVCRGLRRLKKVGLLSFSSQGITLSEAPLPSSSRVLSLLTEKRSATRLIPIPRKLLLYLSRCTKRSVLISALAYCIRGLSLSPRDRTIKNKGSVKASWIAEVFNLSLRAVKGARRELIAMGWISKDIGSFQRKLNRDGAYFEINLSWGREEKRDASPPQFAPPSPKNTPQFAPPKERLKTPYGSKYQETSSGVLTKEKEPSLKNIAREDLESITRTEALYQEALRAGWLVPSEANALNWIGAAIRAKTVKGGDSVRIFVTIVRKKLWHYVTQEQEDRAIAALKRHREKVPNLFRLEEGKETFGFRSELATLVNQALRVAASVPVSKPY